VELARTHRPDLVLVDLATTDSLVAIQALARISPEIHVVALGMPDSEADLVRYAEAGVAGYVSRDATLADLDATLVSAVRGELRCTPRAARVLLRRVASLAAGLDGAGAGASLTARELEIAGMIDAGLCNKDIARRLGIEVSTVKNHVHNILEKLNVRRRGEAARRLRPLLRWPPDSPATKGMTPG
jgi:DNA-binding NarL/FixJ family response regulator